MSDVAPTQDPVQQQRAFPWRTGLRVVLGIYLVTLPACTQLEHTVMRLMAPFTTARMR